MRRSWLPAAVALMAALVSGCGSDDGPAPVSHKPVAVPADRDETAALATLRRLDMCRLLDPPASAESKVHGAPHVCWTDTAGEVSISASLMDRDEEQGVMNAGETITIGGAKAYQVSRSQSRCSVEIPVTFEYAVAFTASKQFGSGDYCTPARTAAEHGVKRLAATTANYLPDTMTYAMWDACSLLGAGLDGQQVRVRINDLQLEPGLDNCLGVPEVPNSGAPNLSLSIAAHQDEFRGDKRHKTIRGADVLLMDRPDCAARWDVGASAHVLLYVQEDAPCPVRDKLLPKLVDSLKAAPPPPTHTELRTYRPDEPDRAAPGACVDYPSGTPCQPYQPVQVPKGNKAAVDAMKADPHVACAVALAAVRKHFGAQFQAVVDATPEPPEGNPAGCYFVSPQHRMQIGFTETDSGILGGDPVIGGYHGLVKSNLPNEQSVAVDTRVKPSDSLSWHWNLSISFANLDPDVKNPDLAKVEQLVPAMTDIVTTYLDH